MCVYVHQNSPGIGLLSMAISHTSTYLSPIPYRGKKNMPFSIEVKEKWLRKDIRRKSFWLFDHSHEPILVAASPEEGRGCGCQNSAAIRCPGQESHTTTPHSLQRNTALRCNIPHLNTQHELTNLYKKAKHMCSPKHNKSILTEWPYVSVSKRGNAIICISNQSLDESVCVRVRVFDKTV